MNHKAVFVSRDHALMVNNGNVDSAEKVELTSGASESVRRLAEDGYRIVALTNEAGVARGRFDEEALELVHRRLKKLLADAHASLDGIYYCPYLDSPEAVVPQYHRASDLRMPRPGMLLQAADDHTIDLSASWMVGRTPESVAAGRAAGCRTVLLGDPENPALDDGQDADYVIETLPEAVDLILSSPPADRLKPTREQTTPEPTPPVTEEAPAARDDAGLEAVTKRLDALLDIQRQEHRVRMRRDFSSTKLLGAVCQMIALGLLLWSWVAMTENQMPAAISRGLSAIAVQLIALTMFVLHQRD